MAGWQTLPLGEVTQRTETLNPHDTPNRDFEYIDVSSVSNKTLSIGQTQSLKGKNAPSRARRLVRTNDILFATVRPTLRRIAIVPAELDNQVCSTGYFVLRPKAELCHRFLFYFLLTSNFNASMERLQKGASYPAVTDNDVRSQLISFPPPPEQRRIVGILDKAFAAIATAKANTEKNLQSTRELFESELGTSFADLWEACPMGMLSDLATDVTDGDHLPPPKSSDGIPFITIGNIDKETRRIDFADTFKVPRSYFEKLKINRRPKKGDVLYTVTGSFGIPVVVEGGREFCFQRHIGLVRPKPEITTKWLYYLLLSPQIFKQADDGATGAAQRTVSLHLLRNFAVPIPSPRQQESIVSSLDALYRNVESLESNYQAKLEKLNQLKRSFLQQAFAGTL